MENYVIIATCEDPKEAYYIKFKLGLDGIESFLISTDSEKDEKPTSKTPLKVQVNAQDVENAIKVLIQVHNETNKTPFNGKMDSVKRILVPIDFSKNSMTACHFAFALAKSLGAEIKLLHVFNDPFIDSGYVTTRISFEKYERNVLYEIEDMARKNMVAFVQLLQAELQKFKLADVKFHYSLLKGKPEYQIIAISEIFKPYMIVLGAQGAGKMPNDIIGSVTTKVIEHTTVPVLAIPENWKYKSLSKINILYATDFHDSDFTAFNNLLEILKPFQVNFECIHIESSETHPWKEMQMFKLESYISQHYPNIPIKCHLINHKNLLKGIEEFVEKQGIDMISFTSPKRSIFYKLVFPNNLKKMVYQSKIPLLIFHTEMEKADNT
jgi:nucleotide-binding universal stress UspA family protein